MNKYQVPKANDKVIVNNKKYIEAEEKEPSKPPVAKPLHAWANQEQQAQRNEWVFLICFVQYFFL